MDDTIKAFTRICIRPTSVAHSHLITKKEPAICDSCNKILIVDYLYIKAENTINRDTQTPDHKIYKLHFQAQQQHN